MGTQLLRSSRLYVSRDIDFLDSNPKGEGLKSRQLKSSKDLYEL